MILRSRYDSSGETETTVKVRGGTVEGQGVRCEWDTVLGKSPTVACSAAEEGKKESRLRSANKGKGIKRIFSKQQEATASKAFGKIDWHTLRPFGPITKVKVWKRINIAGGPSLTIERWKLPAQSSKPAQVILEVSAKVPLAEEAKTADWIAGLVGLSTNGSDQRSETKTRIVLEHFR